MLYIFPYPIITHFHKVSHNNNNNNMSTTTIPYSINVLAAGRRTRDNIIAETGVGIKFTSKVGGANGRTYATYNLTGTQEQTKRAIVMFGEAIQRMENWAQRRKHEKTEQRRNRTNHPGPTKAKAAPTISKAVNGFAGLTIEETNELMVTETAVVKSKLNKKERQAQNKRFVPLVLEDNKVVLPSAPKLSWGDMADDSDSDGDSDEDEDDGFTVVKRR